MEGTDTRFLNNNSVQINQDLIFQFSDSWLLIVLIVSLSLLGWARFFHPKRVNLLLISMFSEKQTYILDRDKKILKDPVAIILTIIHALTLSAFLTLIFYDFSANQITKDSTNLFLFAKILAFVSTVYFVQIIAIDLIGNIFKTEALAYQHKFINLIFEIFTGIILLIFIPIYYYSLNMNYESIVIITLILTFIFKLIRLTRVGIRERKFSYIYLFLYLCSLELVPILIFVKFVTLEIIG